MGHEDGDGAGNGQLRSKWPHDRPQGNVHVGAHVVAEHVGASTLEYRGDAPERFRAELVGAHHIEETGDSLLAQFPREEDARASVRRVVDAGVEVSVRRATLEDVFLKLTGRVLRL